jgi:Fe-S-cluster-containing hydrogenase component 2
MVEIKFLAQVKSEECIGCGVCQCVCPTEAISVVDKKAVVDDKKCLACPNCRDICPEHAIERVVRTVPLRLGIDAKEVEQVDPIKLRELCLKANLHPMQWLCLCTATRVKEGAVAVLKGAKTPEEIALMTGARSGCTAYCLLPSLRLLKAHGVEITQPKGYRWYNVTNSLWDVSEEFIKKHP